MTELWRLGTAELSRRLARREISPVQLLETAMERIGRLDPVLNAIVALNPAAREEAVASERRHAAGTPLGPLDGIPFTVKDNLLVAGMPAVWGSRLFRSHVPTEDELPVARLRRAGAIVVGKTNVPELTLQGYTDNAVFGPTRNPWDTRLTPGGSSGGGVASVAAGMVSFAIGTDGGGSIRRPAGYAGLVGLRPSTGAVARDGGFPHILLDCEVVGPITRTVEDAALVFRMLAGPDRRDRLSLFARPQACLAPKRVLFVPRFGDRPCDPAILASAASFATTLRELGHEVEEDAVPFDLAATEELWSTISRVAARYVTERHGDNVTPAIAAMARDAQGIAATDYLDALERLRRFRAEIARLFERVDIVMTPSSAAMPWPAEEPYPATIGGRDAGPRGHAVYTAWVNLCGHPAIGVPAAPAPSGLPIGVQLVADFGQDDALLALAAQLEVALGWSARWSALAETCGG
jgi:aspartyl-tRNA(Asn)/glutamyl-tRNA(Gln) amidotransferase subunit A